MQSLDRAHMDQLGPCHQRLISGLSCAWLDPLAQETGHLESKCPPKSTQGQGQRLGSLVR